MSDPISLRNVPAEVLQVAHLLSVQSSLSVNAILRLALASGILVEATKLPPQQDGTYGGVEGAHLARALRRHLGSAIDLLLEHEQHPYHVAASLERSNQSNLHQTLHAPPSLHEQSGKAAMFSASMSEELEALGIGRGLAETIG